MHEGTNVAEGDLGALFLWQICIKSVVHAGSLTPNSTLHHHMRNKAKEESIRETAQLLNYGM